MINNPKESYLELLSYTRNRSLNPAVCDQIWGCISLGLGFKGLGFRVLGFRGLGFKA